MMNEEDLAQALAHDLEVKKQELAQKSPHNVAMACLRSAAISARAAECALAICKSNGIPEAQSAAQMALNHIEQALVVLGIMETDE